MKAMPSAAGRPARCLVSKRPRRTVLSSRVWRARGLLFPVERVGRAGNDPFHGRSDVGMVALEEVASREVLQYRLGSAEAAAEGPLLSSAMCELVVAAEVGLKWNPMSFTVVAISTEHRKAAPASPLG